VIVYSTIWAFGSVYFFAFIADIDSTGKLNVLTPAFQTIGLGGGPIIMGLLVGSDNYSAISWSHALFSVLALLIFVPIAWRSAKKSPAGATTPVTLMESELR
jgi:predicted MFS family arabinose efflux permease